MQYILKKRIGNVVETSEAPGPSLLIGRGTNADVRFDDAAVELEHARIDPESDRFVLTALKSVTGTFVNGEQIERAVLGNGDRITIGPFSLVVNYSGAAEPLCLEISSIAPSALPGAGRREVPKVDYAAAYAHGKIFLSKTALSVTLILATGLLLTGFLVAGRTTVFRPGSVSEAHMFIANQCSQCHLPLHGPSNEACKNCHVGPKHHTTQVETARLNESSCVTCHVEHRGVRRLALVANRECVTCHADLKSIDPNTKKEGAPSIFFKKVTDFVTDHPEFAVSKIERTEDGKEKENGKEVARIRLPKAKVISRVTPVSVNPVCSNADKTKPNPDTQEIGDFQGKICLNHDRHLAKKIKDGEDKEVQLTCESCHTLEPDGKRMRKITFAQHCADCHQKRDLKIGNKAGAENLAACVVPHGSVAKVHEYLQIVFADSQCKPFPSEEPEFRLLVAPPKLSLTPSAAERVRLVEEGLFRDRGCALCHAFDRQVTAFPKVEDSFIPARWFRHAEFDHKAHRMLKCEECHIGASKSTQTADVLVPGVETCRSCHRKSDRSGAAQEASATTNCASCHIYHDKTKPMDWKGKGTINSMSSQGNIAEGRGGR